MAEEIAKWIIPRFDWKGSDNPVGQINNMRNIIPRFDWKGSDNAEKEANKAKAIIPRFDWKGSDNSLGDGVICG